MTKAKYTNKCVLCAETIEVGESISFYLKDGKNRAIHEKCEARMCDEDDDMEWHPGHPSNYGDS